MPEEFSNPFRRFRLTLCTSLVVVSVLTGGTAIAEDSAVVPVPVPPPSQLAGRTGSAATSFNLGSSPSHSSGWWLGSTGVALILAVCGAICVAARKFRPQDPTAPLRVIGRVSLSPRHSIFMVRAGQRVLLVGTGSQGPPSLLGELFDDDQNEEATGMAGHGTSLEAARITPPRPPASGPHAVWTSAWEMRNDAFAEDNPTTGPDRRIRSVPACALRRRQRGRFRYVGPRGALPRSEETVLGSGSRVFRDLEPEWEKVDKAASAPPAPSDPRDALRSVPSIALYGLITLAPIALVLSAYVRINIVLVLLRQALGSPQVPGNQVLMVLALLLTALVMRPVGEQVYTRSIEPYMAGKATPSQAWSAGSAPIKAFMVDQIIRTRHQDYLWSMYRYAVPLSMGQADPRFGHEFPFRVVAPAFLLSELTTALWIGFLLYLPFLVIDLVVSAVLAAMGLYMLPPTLVAMPIKLIVFVLADGWLLVSSMLLSTFATGGA